MIFLMNRKTKLAPGKIFYKVYSFLGQDRNEGRRNLSLLLSKIHVFSA